MNISDHSVSTLVGFTEIIHEIAEENDGQLWYRGHDNFDYKLEPSIFRHRSLTRIDDLLNEEDFLIERFRQRGAPFLQKQIDSDMEVLFLMQHYGFPTRLLDWSENPYVGLYFALSTWEQGRDAAVYILNPSRWNQYSLIKRSKDTGRILPAKDRWVEGLSPSKIKEGPEYTLAIYGVYNSDRIVAQRGVFTLFGAQKHNMEQLHGDFTASDHPIDPTRSIAEGEPQQDAPPALWKIKIPTTSAAAMKNSLYKIGFTESVIFPGLDSLAKESKREGF